MFEPLISNDSSELVNPRLYHSMEDGYTHSSDACRNDEKEKSIAALSYQRIGHDQIGSLSEHGGTT